MTLCLSVYKNMFYTLCTCPKNMKIKNIPTYY